MLSLLNLIAIQIDGDGGGDGDGDGDGYVPAISLEDDGVSI